MSLQTGLVGADSLRMKPTPINTMQGSSDQDLVDLYTVHASGDAATNMTDIQVEQASKAAYALESRGYVEQAGIWFHGNRPALQATA